MKKRITVFVCLILTMIMTTGIVYAVSINESIVINRATDAKSCTGTSSVCVMSWNQGTVHTALTNTAEASRYLTSDVSKYEYNKGWTGIQDVQQQITEPGLQVFVSIDRDLDMSGYYYHISSCYRNQYSRELLDKYVYKAVQN